MAKSIEVRYSFSENGMDYYKSVSKPNVVYCRIPLKESMKDKVLWLTTTKWSGGYEPSCDIREGIEMIVVDDHDRVCFKETLYRLNDKTSSTYADKNGMFFDEYIKCVCDDFAVSNNLIPYEEWKKTLLEEKKKLNDKTCDDNWLYFYREIHNRKVAEKFNFYGKKLIVKIEECSHPKCNIEWQCYMLQDEYENNYRISGYKMYWED